MLIMTTERRHAGERAGEDVDRVVCLRVDAWSAGALRVVGGVPWLLGLLAVVEARGPAVLGVLNAA